MWLKFSPNLLLFVLGFLLFAIGAVDVRAQDVAKRNFANRFEVAIDPSKKTAEPAPAIKPPRNTAGAARPYTHAVWFNIANASSLPSPVAGM